MRAHARLLIALLLIALLLAGGGWRLLRTAPAPQAGEALFAAAFPDSLGQTYPLSPWRGKPLVVNFWATWCPPCREEMPELARLAEKYRATGLGVVGIASDDADEVRVFARQHSVSYPLLAGNFEAANLAASLGNSQSVLPYTVLIDPSGRIAQRYLGRLDMLKLERDINALLNAR